MAREGTVAAQVLALFAVKEGEEKRRLTLNEVYKLLPVVAESTIKTAIKRLRGQDGNEKELQAVGYLSQSGGGGLPQPILMLGSEPDVPRDGQHVQMNDEAIRRNKDLRRKQEELRLKRELDAIDNYA